MRLQQSLSLLTILITAACSTSPECPKTAIKAWNSAEERQAATEVAKLPDNSILLPMLEDYARMRREAE